MPKEMTLHYAMSGFVTQDIYSEEEMAAALEISVQELRATLDPTEYGPRKERLGYSFHIHPRANGGVNSEFLFNRTSYTHNLQVFHLRRWLQGRNEWDDIAFNYVVSVHDHYHHHDIGEEKFLNGLVKYRECFGDVTRNAYGRRALSWRKQIPCPEGRTWCEECGNTEIDDTGHCTVCGGNDMIRTEFYTWEDHKETL